MMLTEAFYDRAPGDNMRPRWQDSLALTCIALLLACGGDSSGNGPSRAAFAGTYHASATAYHASVFTITDGGVTTDLLAEGGVLDLTLTEDGRTSGRLFVPGGDEDGSDFDRDLTGTWTLAGDTVRFEHEADTFLRDVPFTLSGDLLTGQYTSDEIVVRAVFVKD